LSNGNIKVKNNIVLQNLPNTACTGQVRALPTLSGILAPNGGFGVWRLFPPNPARAGF